MEVGLKVLIGNSVIPVTTERSIHREYRIAPKTTALYFYIDDLNLALDGPNYGLPTVTTHEYSDRH